MLQLPKEFIQRRLNAVDSSTASIVGIATWCVLHADYSDEIMEIIAENLVDVSLPISIKTSYVYVMHEMLCSCAVNAVSGTVMSTMQDSSGYGITGVVDTGKAAILRAIVKYLPPALKAIGGQIRTNTHGDSEQSSQLDFFNAMLKVIPWWDKLGLFPKDFLKSAAHTCKHYKKLCMQICRSEKEKTDTSDYTAAGLPPQLANITKLYTKYEAAQNKLAKTNNSSEANIIREEVVKRLNMLISAIGGHEVSFAQSQKTEGFLPNLLTQLAQLKREQQEISSPVEGQKAEENASGADEEQQEDVLGSFF